MVLRLINCFARGSFMLRVVMTGPILLSTINGQLSPSSVSRAWSH
jgi:hypothetical protein